ncbi:TetR/AcrR family transcriptional regulator [Phyllobacterium zundukense]|uniref:TetR/AcrR family transcriptional regulator n=1 Tax=Phyllobacterium zundukense TaxID=1867719 RepID=A0ACD4CV06_9HYPH|nr:TetR/AcrR family transcriptional regulator [Phyllobacterium zundukense]UXN57409.1 TetR/AcrR family transcriptional regulator [Phyllobacterium zundukense]
MGHSQAEKAQSRERILSEAADQIRAGGLESVSVGTLMKSVNLTHGGFYGHFASRADLLTQALKRALVDGAHRSAEVTAHPRAFAGFVRNYLSRNHRDSRSTGCAISALISDVGRADAQAKTVMAGSIEDYIATTRRQLGDDDDSRAMLAISALVGALALSRVMTDPARSDALLHSVCEQLMAFNEPNELAHTDNQDEA